MENSDTVRPCFTHNHKWPSNRQDYSQIHNEL